MLSQRNNLILILNLSPFSYTLVPKFYWIKWNILFPVQLFTIWKSLLSLNGLELKKESNFQS